MLRKAAARFDKALFEPATIPDDLVLGLALAPVVAAGLLLFHRPALEMLGISVGVGGATHLAARLTRQPLAQSPILPAVIGVGLLGPGALFWAPLVAAIAAVLELLRTRLVPGLRLQMGLVAFSAVFLATRGASAAYVNPADLRPLAEPIRLWLAYFGGAADPVDPIRLYVGNVSGPVFATSLLAVAVSGAWLWYARRLSLGAIVGVGLAVAAAAVYLRWSPVFQLDSGPLWFAAVLLADRRSLPGPRLLHPLVGVAAGLAVMAGRRRGIAIEGAYFTVVALQVLTSAGRGAVWLIVERRTWIGRLRGRRTSPQLAFPTVIPGQAGDGPANAHRGSRRSA